MVTVSVLIFPDVSTRKYVVNAPESSFALYQNRFMLQAGQTWEEEEPNVINGIRVTLRLAETEEVRTEYHNMANSNA